MSNVPMTLPNLVIKTMAAPYSHTSNSAQFDDNGDIWEFFQNVDSCMEEPRVIVGPIEPTRPQEIYRRKLLPLKWFYGGKEPANNPDL